MPKFTPPENVSGIGASTGRYFPVEGGVLTPPDDATDTEVQEIIRAGFVAEDAASAVIVAPLTPPALKGGSSKAAAE